MEPLLELAYSTNMDKKDAICNVLCIMEVFKTYHVPLTRSMIKEVCQWGDLVFIHFTCSIALKNLIKEYNLPTYSYDYIFWDFIETFGFYERLMKEHFIEMLHDKFFRHDVEPKAILILQKIFAIDGLENGDFDNLWDYVERLAFGLEKKSMKDRLGVHTQAVRKLYEAGATPSQIYETLLKWSENSETDTWMQLYEQNLEDSLKNEIREWIKMKIKNRVWDKNGKSNTYEYKYYRRD